ncbi:MAG: hypothetical protein EP312_00075 [Gammaproteobacteria bacterium]|nr:MAG: hypothetical protein EP312_00075 [Gammaproteobacteria bacterium]
MNWHHTLFASVMLLSMAGTAAHADDYSGIYVGVDGGPSWYADDDMYRFYSLDDDDVAWSVHAGYRINKWVAVDVAYTDLGEYGVTDIFGITPGIVSGDNSFRDVTVGAIGYFPFGPGFSAYAKLAAGVLEADWYGPWNDDSGFVTVFAAGIQWTPPDVKALTLRAGFESHGFWVEQDVLQTIGSTTFYYTEDYYQSLGMMTVGVQFNF